MLFLSLIFLNQEERFKDIHLGLFVVLHPGKKTGVLVLVIEVYLLQSHKKFESLPED